MDVLAVDDGPAQLRFLMRLISLLGHRCRMADSGEALVRECSSSLPDAVVSDIDLGDADGVELCLGLRQRRPDIRIVLVTGSQDSAERARLSGFERVLLKPFSMEALKDALA